MTQLRQESIVDGYKLFVKAVILQVNGMASSTNTLWAVDGQARDINLSVSWYLPLAFSLSLKISHTHSLILSLTQGIDFSYSFFDSLSPLLVG